MSYRTNPDRILDNIDRARNRDAESARSVSYTHLTLPTNREV